MKIQMFTVGKFLTNRYIVSFEKTKETIIIDSGFDTQREAEEILNYIRHHVLKPKYIINTHGHPDHLGLTLIIGAAASLTIYTTAAPITGAINKTDIKT